MNDSNWAELLEAIAWRAAALVLAVTLLLVATTATAAPVADLEAMRACAARVLGVDEPRGLPRVAPVPHSVIARINPRAMAVYYHETRSMLVSLVALNTDLAGRTLAHELAHFVQGMSGRIPPGDIPDALRTVLEAEAERVAARCTPRGDPA